MTATRVDCALPLALELVGAVRDHDSRTVEHVLDVADVPALAVVLAAMVDETKTPRELLQWVDDAHDPQSGWHRGLRRAHTLYGIYRRRGAQMPAVVLEGERLYQREKKRQQRAKACDRAIA